MGDLDSSLSIFQQMAELASDAFFVTDVQGRVLYVNDAAVSLSGYDCDELCRMSVSDLYPRFPAERVRQLVDAVPEQGVPAFETVAQRKDGSLSSIGVSLARFSLGAKQYFFGVVQDISERKRLEAARQSLPRRMFQTLDSERQRLARDLDREVARAVAVVGGLLEDIEHSPGAVGKSRDAKVGSLQDKVRRITEAVARIVRDCHPADLGGLGLEDTLRSYATEVARRHGFTLHLRTMPVAGLLTPGQELLLYRIVQEALANVARHAQARVVTVRMRRSRNRLTVVVRDNGVGFWCDAPERIGSGLISMRERALLLGTELEVGSVPGKGAEIRVVVPLGKAATGALAAEARTAFNSHEAAVTRAMRAARRVRRVRTVPRPRPLPKMLNPAIFRRMADMASEVFYLTDAVGMLVYANQRATALTGYTCDELLGMPFLALHPDIPPREFVQSIRALAQGPLSPVEMRLRRKDGSYALVEVSGARIDVKDTHLLFGIVRDIHERKQTEAMQHEATRDTLQTIEGERLRVARELHDDIGQAVATVGVLLHVLAGGPKSYADWRRAVAPIRASIEQVKQSVVRLVRDHQPPGLRSRGFDETVGAHVRTFCSHHGLKLRLTTVPMDELLGPERALNLYRIIQEAVANVAKHAAAHEVRVDVRRSGGEVVVSVQDDGRGFEPSRPRAGGTFGLTTMRERAAAMGALLTVSSVRGEGTEVRVVVSLDE